MFVLYECAKCKNRGYHEAAAKAVCSLCGSAVEPALTAANEESAKAELIRFIARSVKYGEGKVKRGLGTRRRVFSIVESLFELRRGRPVTRSMFLNECDEAGIDREKAMHHLSLLLENGEVINTTEGYRPGTIEEVI